MSSSSEACQAAPVVGLVRAVAGVANAEGKPALVRHGHVTSGSDLIARNAQRAPRLLPRVAARIRDPEATPRCGRCRARRAHAALARPHPAEPSLGAYSCGVGAAGDA